VVLVKLPWVKKETNNKIPQNKRGKKKRRDEKKNKENKLGKSRMTLD
jgi:hypothetical protein